MWDAHLVRLVTPSGHVAIHKRGWPLAGLDFPRSHYTGTATISLLGLDARNATYAELYRTNPWVYASVNTIARGIARMPLKVYQLDAAGNRTRVRGDIPSPGRPSAGAALDNMLRRPEPGVSRREWLYKVLLDRLVYGNALVIKERRAGSIVGLWHAPWRKVAVQEGETVPILFYDVRGDAWVGMTPFTPRLQGPASDAGRNSIQVIPEDAIHFGRAGDLDSPIGLSPLAPLKFTLALHDALWRHLTAYFQNQARPSGLVKVSPETARDDKMRELIRAEVQRLYTSPDNAGKVMITSAEWQSITDSPDHAQIVELAKLSREEIVMNFGLAPTDTGIMDHGVQSNVANNRSRFVRDTIGQWANEVEDEFNSQLLPENPSWNGLFTEFDLAEMVRPDLESRAATFEKLRGVYTPNEMRSIENLTPLDIEGADTVWLPSGQIGLGIEPPAPPAAEPPAEEPPADPPPAEGEEGEAA